MLRYSSTFLFSDAKYIPMTNFICNLELGEGVLVCWDKEDPRSGRERRDVAGSQRYARFSRNLGHPHVGPCPRIELNFMFSASLAAWLHEHLGV